MFALAQHDLKRLLAYHSVENIGIIALGLGVGVLGMSIGSPPLAVLGFCSGLLHRWLEIQRSGAFVREQLESLPSGAVREPLSLPMCSASCDVRTPLLPNHLAVALVEGWRGQICHVVIIDEAGRFKRYKVIDPSFYNWTGLAMALRGQQISDFPLCNKSFNLSYCGFDL